MFPTCTALSDALHSGGDADDPACHWLYDTLLSADPVRLAALAFQPLLAALYLRGSAAFRRSFHPRSPSPHFTTHRQPPPIPPPVANPVVGVLSPPLEPQAAVKSTKRAGIIGVAFEAYYSKISQMPAASKVDACNAVAAWAGQYCKCRFELDEKDLEEDEGDSLGSVSPMSSETENGKQLEEELARMRVNGDSSGRNCNEEEVKEARVPLPWELLQPVMRVWKPVSLFYIDLLLFFYLYCSLYTSSTLAEERIMTDESHMKNIKPFNDIDFPLWKEMVQDILKSLELDYVLHKDKPLPFSSDIEKYDEKMHEYQFKLEKWEKDNKFAKRIIKRSISEGIKGEFDDNEDTTASELFFLIELEHKRVSTRFLFTRLTTLRYDGYSGIVKYIRSMYDIAYELRCCKVWKPVSLFYIDLLLFFYLYCSLYTSSTLAEEGIMTVDVRDAAAEAVRVVYARACHDLVPQAILASRSLIELDKSARKAAKAAAAAASGTVVVAGTAGSTASSSRPSSKPNTPSKQRKPDVLLNQ
ncbi:hypothetical protein EJB05_29222, partial [Eragrostis curvula]